MPDYVAQVIIDPGEDGLTLEHVMAQKYIAMFLQPEAYADYRNIPNLDSGPDSKMPVRWDYASDEYLLNENLQEDSVNIFTDRVGWNRKLYIRFRNGL